MNLSPIRTADRQLFPALRSGQIVPSRRRRRSMRAGHRSKTWHGVSASSRHTVHRPAGQLMSEHFVSSYSRFTGPYGCCRYSWILDNLHSPNTSLDFGVPPSRAAPTLGDPSRGYATPMTVTASACSAENREQLQAVQERPSAASWMQLLWLRVWNHIGQ